MNRLIVYPGAIPLDTDALTPQRNAMIAFGALIRASLGAGTYADGFAISQNAVPDLNVIVGPGSLTSLTTVDPSAFGSLGTSASALMKQGINLGNTTLACAAPGTVGHSINYLIQASFSEADGTPVVLPYYNASNPATPYTGPAGAGTSQNTVRSQSVTLQAKAGTSATTGTQTTPSADAGYVGLYVVTVAYGQTTITNGDLTSAELPAAPFIRAKASDMQPMPGPTAFTSSGTYTVPNGVTKLRVRAWGAGGGGGGNTTQGGGGGGGGGAYVEHIITVTPGQAVTVTRGAGGAGGSNSSGTAAGNDGATGGSTTVAGSGFTTITAPGGDGGGGSVSSGQGDSGVGGIGSGGTVNMTGQAGQAGLYISGALGMGGMGGAAAAGGGGGGGSTGLPGAGSSPGGGGAGGGSNYAGGAGGNGMVVLEPIGRA